MSVPFDVRYGLRKLNNGTGFTLVAVACLALGIGASITVFSVVNTLLLRPVPGVERTDRIVSLATKPGVLKEMPGVLVTSPISLPAFRRYQEAIRVFSGLAAYHPVKVTLLVEREPLRVSGQAVTDNYFTLLGVRGHRGRLFGPGEGRREGRPGVVISHALWRRAFSARPEAVGSSGDLNGSTFDIIGVARPGFQGVVHGEPVDLWMLIEDAPLVVPELRGGKLNDPDHAWLFWFLGRLAPDVDIAHAQKELDTLAAQAADALDEEERPPALRIYRGIGIRPGTRKDLASPLALLSAVVGLLMLVVCANLGGLLLVRAVARQEEIGIRLALGVTRGRLVRQLLIESLTLALCGGIVGFIMALWAVDGLRGLSLGKFLPRMTDLAVDGRVVAFALGLSLAAGVLFGLIPALWSTRGQVAPMLRRGASGVSKTGRNLLQEMFVVGQVMVSLMLLVITGLFVRTLWNLESIDPGFDSRRIVNLRLDLSTRNYSAPAGSAFYEQLLDQVRRLPDIRSASLALWVPLSSANERGGSGGLLYPAGAGDREPLFSDYNVVSPGYFRGLGIQVLHGDDFSAADRQGSPPVLIVDETIAKALWPGGNPVGERVTLTNGEVRTVVGVVRSVHVQNLSADPQPCYYLPLAQRYEPAMTLQVRTAGNPPPAVNALLSLLRKLDSRLAARVSLYEDEVRESFVQPRLFSWLLSIFSLVAVAVTAIGLYGTLAYTISRRTRELGIRMALGAQGSEILNLVLRQGLGLTLTGLLLGLTAAAWTTSLFSSMLFGVTPTDPGVFAVVALLLTVVALAASYLPAHSATRIDPMAIIRHE